MMALANGGNIAAATALAWHSRVSCAVRRPRPKNENKVSGQRRRRREEEAVVLGGGGGVGFGEVVKKEATWQCARGCGACCKLDKGPTFPTPEEIFLDDPSHLQLYKSLIGPDGWCIHYEHPTRTCSIYPERPFFCRVEPDVFQTLYGINPKRFNREACSSCRDTITAIYGSGSEELKNFNSVIKNSIQKS